jgi:uncharacterized protein YbjT (DUF2867 family)
VNTVVVLGGSGFVGRHVVPRLAQAGWRVCVPTRQRERAKHLITLPNVDVVDADIHDPAALARLFAGAQAVVNLVGIIAESGGGSFERVHTSLTRAALEAAREAGGLRFVQVSSLNADPDGPSEYQRSKGRAEQAIAASGLPWTILQPSVIFGREDGFLNLFARLQRLLPVMVLACPDARFQPVYVGDVAHAVATSLAEPGTVGKRYPLCGPRVYTLRELVRYVGELTGHRRGIIGLGPTASRMQAAALEMLPGKLMSVDNIDSMSVDSVCDCPYPEIFGGRPEPLEAIAPSYLGRGNGTDPFARFRSRPPR